jgi:hypothetical protein
MRRFWWVTAYLTAGLAVAASGEAELAPFAPPWDDGAAGPTDLRPLLGQSADSITPVRAREGHLYAGDRRLRLFGANLTSGACCPDHATADGVAARLAKFGLNGVRLHFLDSTWGEVRLIDYASGDWSRWNPDAQDRLDYFLAQLKRQGIYWNVNLLVGRAFGKSDGVDPAIAKLDWKAAHAVGFFHAPHLEAQKAYARRLLTHVNPYTGLALGQDPALAMVEINNENGLLHTWLSGDFDTLPEPFAGDLKRQWNAWLAKRYRDTAALAVAWGARREPLGEELLRNAAFADNAKGWVVEQHRGARAACTSADGEATLRVENPADGGWAVQLNQRGFAVRKGALYTVRFRAAADTPRRVTATVMQAHEPWLSLGWQTRLELDRDWKSFSFTFVAGADDADARFGFNDLAQAGAAFRFASVSLKPGGTLGPQEDETFETASLRCPTSAGARPLTDGGRQDWIRFLWETERAHWEAMRRCVADELGIQAPVVGTIVATSTPNLMAGFDLVDTHAYWQHPHFPGRHWDQDNWTVKSLSMADHPQDATLSRLAWQRVAGKPHMVSEYNHPAPNPYAGEGPLLLAAIAALQDWDALFYYTWSHEEAKTKAGRIPHFFDVGQHPTIVANLPAAALLFRRGDVAAARTLVTAPLPPETEIARIAQKGRAWSVLDLGGPGVELTQAFEHRVALDLSATAGGSPAAAPAAARTEWLADTGELAWRLPEKGQGLFEVRTPRTKLLVGHAAGRTVDLGHGVRVTPGQTSLGWCTVALSLLEGEAFDRAPRRALLTATAYTQNTGMVWKDEARTSVGTRWGVAPSLVEPVPATVAFAPAAGAVRLYPLDARGQRSGPAVMAAAGGSLALGPPHRTLWYEVVFGAPGPAR